MAPLKQTRMLLAGLIFLAIVSILSLVIALYAQASVAAAKEEQNQKLRAAICGTFVDVAASPITPQTTALGKRLIRDTDRGATVAGCPR